ncbi:MAG: biotin carboxylase N-terminal domain-containing protein, partial [Desulfatiglandales bacterium]
MFKRILVANRGEIAVRIIRTLKEMGIETVSIYSEADERSLHVFEADQAHLVGPAEPVQSYLNIPRIIEIAKRTHSEAIHPGYGFLAENPHFAK